MTKELKAEIIAIGTELLLGQIANTNAQWLSEMLAINGINTYHHTVVGDNLIRVEKTFRQAHDRSDVIIVSGGLGPTEDDMTREAFQQMSNLEMTEHRPAMKKIETFYANQKTKMTPNNKKQVRIFEGAQVIENRLGMAPGMIVTYDDKIWVFLPGVPKELKQMAEDDLFPFLIKQNGEQMVIESLLLRFIGIGESLLESLLEDMIQTQQNPTIAPLAQDEGVVIRLTAKDTSVENAKQLIEQTKEKILERVGPYFYGTGKETIQDKVFTLLKEKNMRISAAESITGGLFIERLISIVGASSVCPGGIICYDANVKKSILHISSELINTKGTVSEECALEMAANICDVMDSHIGISFTGIAGPDELEGKPIGTVFIAVYSKTNDHLVEKFTFQGDREAIRNRATLKGYEILFNYLKSI